MAATAVVPVELRERVADVLRRAALVVEVNGWYQGGYCDTGIGSRENRPAEQCPVCVLGAVSVVVFEDPDRIEVVLVDAEECGFDSLDGDETAAWWAVTVVADVVTPDDLASLISRVGGWNDDPARTKEQVTAVLRAAAGRVEADVPASGPGGDVS